MTTPVSTAPDRNRWWILVFVLVAGTAVVIDTTVLNVSVPTIRHDLHASLASVQWVLTGYSLVFASLLVIGGRLGDLFGPRRLAIVGVAVFGVGSLVASMAPNVGTLILGEAIIEGIGGALLLPSILSILAKTFTGQERATAYAAMAAALSSGSIFGPVLGGYLTTYHSWRWSFRINVILAPIVVVALSLLGRKDEARGKRSRLDAQGALLVTLGAFLVVFGVSEGNAYGYIRAISHFTISGVSAWPTALPLSVVPVAVVVGVALLVAFVRVERAAERRNAEPLFAISQFRIRTFSVATTIGGFIAFAQVGTSFCLALYLQGSRHLTPVQNGLWVLPSGAASVLGAPIGGWLSRHFESTKVFRTGMAIHVTGLLAEALLLRSSLPYAYILPAFAVYGFGNGLLMSQLNRVLLHEIDPAGAGAASGMSATVRQVASACGVAANGAVFAAASTHLGLHAAITPAMLMSASALFAGAVLAWRLPPIGIEPRTAQTDMADIEALMETEAQVNGVALSVSDADR